MNRSRETMQFIQASRYLRPHTPPRRVREHVRPCTKNYWLPFRSTVITAASVLVVETAFFHPFPSSLYGNVCTRRTSTRHNSKRIDPPQNRPAALLTYSSDVAVGAFFAIVFAPQKRFYRRSEEPIYHERPTES